MIPLRAGGASEDAALLNTPPPETVTAFTRRVKALLEGGVSPCWIRGEVSNCRAQASGHVYFSLKDAGAQLSAVLFRADALRQPVDLGPKFGVQGRRAPLAQVALHDP